MSVAETPIAIEQPITRQITAEDFLYALWGITQGEPPKLRPAPVPYRHSPPVREWLWRMYGIGGPEDQS